MSIVKADSPYHVQNLNFWCGAAAAMMILADSNVGVPYKNLKQKDLYDLGHGASTGNWHMSPEALVKTLKHHASNRSFRVHSSSIEEEATRDVVRALVEHGVPPAVLVEKEDHWVVVDAIETDVDPAGGNDYILKRLHVYDPWCAPISEFRSHFDGDDCPDIGCPSEWCEYPQGWRDRFWSCDCGSGQREYLSVSEELNSNIKIPKAKMVVPKFEGEDPATPQVVREVCKDLLRESSLFSSEIAGEYLKGAEPGVPYLVARLDRIGSYYYLVPLFALERLVAVAKIDARWGYLHSVRFEGVVSGSESYMSKAPLLGMEAKEVREHLINRGPALDVKNGRQRSFFKSTTFVLPVLVWRPCRESRSPYLPFFEVWEGGRKSYIRVDGKLFQKLTTTKKGA